MKYEYWSDLMEKWFERQVDPVSYDGPVPPITDGIIQTEHPELLTTEDVQRAIGAKGGISSPTVRAEVLDEAKQLTTGDRNRDYGDPVPNFQDTADLWNVQFRNKFKEGEHFTPSDVAKAMVHLKMARMIRRNKRDNWVDAIGYAALGAECDERAAIKHGNPFEPHVLPCATGRKQIPDELHDRASY